MYVELLHDMDCREADTETWSNRQEHASLPVNTTDLNQEESVWNCIVWSVERRNLSSHWYQIMKSLLEAPFEALELIDRNEELKVK